MNTLNGNKTALLLVYFFFFLCTLNAQTLEDSIDKLLLDKYRTNDTGATVLISKKGKIIYHKAFGMANLELDIPMKTDHVFQIGSMTKQFTAIAILMLEEKGLLNLNEPITKYISDYPTNGKTITIHQLLTHTSGIKSYTSVKGLKIYCTQRFKSNRINRFL